MVRILAIESSCDETALALLDALPDGTQRLLAERVFSQWQEHAAFGGVIPEVAARAHLARLPGLAREVLAEGGGGPPELVAATLGPGLAGGLLTGASFARGLALGWGAPFLGVHHLAAHAAAGALLSPPPAFPYLLLLVSGGHGQLLAAEGGGRFRLYGSSLDDAPGEALDKAARLLGLGWPGGPALERAAAALEARCGAGEARRLAEAACRLPEPLKGGQGCDLSFSGLKSALARLLAARPPASEDERDALAWGFQARVTESIARATGRACARFVQDYGPASGPELLAAGGVAANGRLRRLLQETAEAAGARLRLLPPALCTDNAAMVAAAAAEMWFARKGGQSGAGGASEGEGWEEFLAPVRPRWPLAEAEPASSL